MPEQGQQLVIFEAVKTRLGPELDSDMISWDFSKMMEELKRVIEAVRPAGEKHPVRYFSRRYLKMRNEAFHSVKKWIARTAIMNEDDIALVLKAIRSLRTEKTAAPSDDRSKDIAGKLASHVIVSLNSFSELMTASGAKPADVSEGDKMSIKQGIKEFCTCCGIPVVFPEDTSGYRPITDADLKKIGVPNITKGL